MGKYAATAQLAAAATKPTLIIATDGSIQPVMEGIFLGCYSTPADQLYRYGLFYQTDAGTGGTAVTPIKREAAATSSATCKKGTFAVDPTTSGVALVSIMAYHRTPRQIPMNPDQIRLILTTATHGFGLWCSTAPSTDNFEATFWWIE